MGRYVEFWEGFSDGVSGHFFSLIKPFKEWYEDFLTGEYSEEASHNVYDLINLVYENPSKITVHEINQAIIVDQMISEFYSDFLGSTPYNSELISISDTMLRVQRYQKWLPWINSNVGKNTGHYWDYILNGRGVGRKADEIPFNSIDGSYLVGFWTIEECIESYAAISSVNLPDPNDSPDGDIPYIVKNVLAQATKNKHGVIIIVA